MALDLAAIPADLVEAAKLHLLDTLGCGLAAHARGEAAYVGAAAAETEATGPGFPHGLPAAEAAPVNGALCHALDCDDTHAASVVHVSASVVPAALGAAQERGRASPARQRAGGDAPGRAPGWPPRPLARSCAPALPSSAPRPSRRTGRARRLSWSRQVHRAKERFVSASAEQTNATAAASPEAVPTPKELIERAIALRPKLIAAQADAEERTYYSEEMHEEFKKAGFYRMFIPRRYGGFEVDVPTFMRVVVEIARGCPGTAWCMALASNHALMVGSWFPKETQDEVFEGARFICASVAAPLEGLATPVDGGWELNGKVSYCSGIPYSTYFMGQAFTPSDTPGEPGPMLLYVAPRGAWRMLDDWGDLLGLKASGSQSIVFEHGRIPAHYALENTVMIDIDVAGGTPGYRLHGNPLYAGRALGIFTMCLAAVMVGAAYNALDEYGEQISTRKTVVPPYIPRREDPDSQRYFGGAWAKIATAEAALRNCAEQHMELCRRNVEDGVPFSYADDVLLSCIAREVMVQCWETVQSELVRTIGASFLRTGQRMERIYRDMSIGNAHRNTSLRDWAYRELAMAHFGIPSPTQPSRRRPSARSAEPGGAGA